MVWNWKWKQMLLSKYLYFKPISNYTRKGFWKGTLIYWNCDTLICFRSVAYSTWNVGSFHHVKHNLSLMSSNSSRKRLKCLGENLVLCSQYIYCRFVSQSLKATTKSQMNVCHLCINLDNPCATFNKGKTQTRPNKVSTSHKSS